MYYAFKKNGECVARGESEFHLDDVTIIRHDAVFDLQSILYDGSNIIENENQINDDVDMQIIETSSSFSELQLDLMETIAELNEAVLLREMSTESEV